MKKIEPHDPIITTYALGEASEADQKRVEQAVCENKELGAHIDIAAEFSRFLEDSLFPMNEHRLSEDHLEEIRRRGRKQRRRGKVSSFALARRAQDHSSPVMKGDKKRLAWLVGTAAACLALVATLLYHIEVDPRGGQLAQEDHSGQPALNEFQVRLIEPIINHAVSTPEVARVGTPLSPVADDLAKHYDDTKHGEELLALMKKNPQKFRELLVAVAAQSEITLKELLPSLAENDYKSAKKRSVVPTSAGVTSYPRLEHYITEKDHLPPRELLKVEELVNHLDYYELSQSHGALNVGGYQVGVELATCPWNEKALLAAIQLRALEAAPRSRVIRPVVHFEPEDAAMFSYRLVGYSQHEDSSKNETNGYSNQVFVSGQRSHLVFYEIRPKTGQPARESPLFTLKLYDESEADESQASHELASLKVYSRATNWHDSSDGFKMASAICASGLHLIDSRHLPDLSEDWLQAKLSELAENQQLHTRESRTLNLMQKAIELQSLQEAEEEMMMSSPPLKKPSR